MTEAPLPVAALLELHKRHNAYALLFHYVSLNSPTEVGKTSCPSGMCIARSRRLGSAVFWGFLKR